MGEKYEMVLSGKTLFSNVEKPSYRIRALRDIPRHKVCIGDMGGTIEGEWNLSQEGDCWVSGKAHVEEQGQVFGDAWVGDAACVKGQASVYGNAHVGGDVLVTGHADISGEALVEGMSQVRDRAQVRGGKVLGTAYLGGRRCGVRSRVH